MKYFFDSYAIIEVIRSNPKYARHSEEQAITTAANLGEVRGYALRTGQTQEYGIAMERMSPELLQTEREDWEKAADFRFSQRGKRISLIDGLGYRLAQKHRLLFLTGDAKFETLADVEFVK